MEVDQKPHGEVYYNNFWAPIRNTIESFLKPQPNSGLSSFHETFTLIYKCVCDGKAKKLHMDLLELCAAHLKTVNARLMDVLIADPSQSKEEKMAVLIKDFDEQLSIYLKASSNISSVFCYLVKFLEEKSNYGCPLESQLKEMFCQEVVEHYVYEILDYLDSSPSPHLDPLLIQRLLNNLKIVSHHEFSAKYTTLYSRYGTPSPTGLYQPVLSEVQLAERMCQEVVGKQQICTYVIGLNPAQKRRVDERD